MHHAKCGVGTLQAIDAIEQLRQNVDTLIIIPNDKLLEAVDPNMPVRATTMEPMQCSQPNVPWAAGSGPPTACCRCRSWMPSKWPMTFCAKVSAASPTSSP